MWESDRQSTEILINLHIITPSHTDATLSISNPPLASLEIIWSFRSAWGPKKARGSFFFPNLCFCSSGTEWRNSGTLSSSKIDPNTIKPWSVSIKSGSWWSVRLETHEVFFFLLFIKNNPSNFFLIYLNPMPSGSDDQLILAFQSKYFSSVLTEFLFNILISTQAIWRSRPRKITER